MNRGDFHELLRRVDERFGGRPEALERSTGRWVIFGLSVLSAWLLFLCVLAFGLMLGGIMATAPMNFVLIALGAGVGLYVFGQFHLLFVVGPLKPDGQLLRLEEAPELRAMLDDLRIDLGCPAFAEVRISSDLNAGVIEVGRAGRFARTRTILEIGLPLLLILSVEELRAVLAHEFVHLSARHDRGGARIQRLHRRWSTLFVQFHKPGTDDFRKAARWAASSFVDWYWPRLQARSLLLSRQHEHHADRVAAGVSSREALVSALWQLECRGPWLLERFWPDQHRSAVDQPEPPVDIMARLREALLDPPPSDDSARWVGKALNRRTLLDETHPAFFNRALALGVAEDDLLASRFPVAHPDQSASTLLGTELDRLLVERSETWRNSERPGWRARHRKAQGEARRQKTGAQTDSTAEAGSRNLARLWLTAREAVELRGLAAATAQLEAVLERSPDHAGASVLLGQHLASQGNPEGERLLWAVANAGDEHWTCPACQALESHYRASGQTELQRQARNRLDRHEGDVEKARVERATIDPGDHFGPHELSDETLQTLRQLLQGQGCASAWLARKVVHAFPERPVFVLAVRSPSKRWGADSERDARLVQSLVGRVALAGQVLVVTRSGSFASLARAIESVPGARVYPEDSRPSLQDV